MFFFLCFIEYEHLLVLVNQNKIFIVYLIFVFVSEKTCSFEIIITIIIINLTRISTILFLFLEL
jgi:hypothetical protein